MSAPSIVDSKLRSDGWHPASAVARALGIHVSTVYRAAADGKISGRRVGRSWYVRLDTVAAYYQDAQEIKDALATLAEA